MEEKTMKKTLFYLCALSCAALISCNKENQAPEAVEGGTISLVANATSEEVGKAYLGELSDTKYPVYWNEVESSSLAEFCGTDFTQEASSESFEKDAQDASKGKFGFTLDQKEGETFSYFAVTPGRTVEGKNPTNGWRPYDNAKKPGNISYALDINNPQTPLADRPDPTTHIMVGSVKDHQGQAEKMDLPFAPVVGYGKMTVTNFPELAEDETVSKITITVPSGKVMIGRLYQDIQTNEKTPYSANAVKNFVSIDPANITFNTTGFDVWFTTYPFDLAKDDMLTVTVETSAKKYEGNLKISKALSFKAGVVSAFTYNWTKSQPQGETKTLTFDFSSTPLEGWPTAKAWATDSKDMICTYTVDKVDYSFRLVYCITKNTTGQITWDATNGLTLWTQWRYVGFPAIKDMKLIKFEFVQGTAPKNSRKGAVTSNTDMDNPIYVSGGEEQAFDKDSASFALQGTLPDTQYFFVCTAGGIGAKSITLTYEKVEK